LGERILIADDDPDILRFVEINLRLEGYELTTASDGVAALDKALAERPDLVLLDVMMPELDGFEVCSRLRKDPRTSNISIIMLTAKSMSADKVLGLTAGADDYILKPFDPLELVARVKSTLRRAKDMKDVNPLTGLPGNAMILQDLQRRIDQKVPFALMHIDLDNFKAFNDYYGFARGDTVIKLVAQVLQDAVAEQDPVTGFSGHIGGDDFAALCEASAAASLAKQIIVDFEAQISSLYDPADSARGYITVADRRDETHDFPLMTIAIGIATNSHREIESHWEASEIAGELKLFAKKQEGSGWVMDRRGERS
jgi:diguanylate cyclase (GGDEF)-like protein